MTDLETPTAVDLFLMMEENVPCMIGSLVPSEPVDPIQGEHPAHVIVTWVHTEDGSESCIPPMPFCATHWEAVNPETTNFFMRLARAAGKVEPMKCGCNRPLSVQSVRSLKDV